MEKQTPKRGPRAKNFTPSEIDVLVTEVDKRRHVLFGPLRGPSLTHFHRARAWEQVLSCVNAVAPAIRTVGELKKKFKDMKNRVKTTADDGRLEKLVASSSTFLELKRRELELKEESTNCKRKHSS
ncbi:hypothetical protein MTP99_002497 [Tenebrio molitor]|nr:hypothetical protein MTP99_002497 [Tenebrio molitor]